VQHLALALMGPAAKILRGFDDSSDKALDDLWGRLRHRFGTVDECQQAMSDFESRRQSDTESLAEFEQVLRTHLDRACRWRVGSLLVGIVVGFL